MMTVKHVFDLGVKMGIQADPRGPKGVEKYLARMKKEYDAMRPSDKEYFDQEWLTNPYPDSVIHVDDGKTKVKRILAGIDISSSDILLATQLNERGKMIDLALSHHPVGKALANLHVVMEMAVDILHAIGLPVHLAEKMTEERIREVGRGLHPVNHYQTVDLAKLLGVNFISTHTITDNLVQQFITDLLNKEKPETLGDLMEVLMDIPEYQQAKRMGSGPKIFSGSPNHRLGKYVIEMTGGTEPSNKIYPGLSSSGISTIISMHMREPSMEKANEHHLNIFVTGHMSSDSIGMNLYLDELEKKGIEIVPCGGLIRVSRNKTKKKK